MTLDIRLRELNVAVDFRVPARIKNESLVAHALPFSIGMKHERNRKSVVFYNIARSAYLEILINEMQGSLRGYGWARSTKEWKTFIGDLAPVLADVYEVSEHPLHYVRSLNCECQLGNRNYKLDLASFVPLLASFHFLVKESDSYSLFFEVGSASVHLDFNGKVLLKGLKERAQIYSLVQLLDAIRVALEFRDYFEGKENKEGVYPGVKFDIECDQIPIMAISPTQKDVDIRGVKYYRELLREKAHLRVVVYIAQVDKKMRYVLLDGHHRARACYEEGWDQVNALILRPSSVVECQAVVDLKREGVNTIADLSYRILHEERPRSIPSDYN
ncbi:MAG: hypothetical protein QXP20_05410 [Candidatus Bathyarchaeia archaeon]